MPTEFGGAGLALDEYSKLVRRLAYVAPATALATNMHCYWTGVAADLLKGGDESCRFILEQAAEGEVFCALHGEAGNDMPLLLAVATADRADGGWEISGHKIFGSLTPVWTRGGFHAMDTSNPDAPQIVHGFLPRDADGIQVIETWDTLGMRATQSQDTVLDKAFVPDELVALVCPTGFAGAGMFHVAIFAWALMGFASTYLGAAKRAFDMTVEAHAQAHVDRADQLDGAPPRGAAPGCRDADRLRRGRGHARAHVRGLDRRCRTRGLAGSPGGDAVAS